MHAEPSSYTCQIIRHWIAQHVLQRTNLTCLSIDSSVYSCRNKCVSLGELLRGEEKTEMCFLLLTVNWFLLRDISASSGTRNSGDILLYDVRQKDCIVRFQSHRQEVCGLKWCPNGRYLASGSNDNTVCVWDFHQWSSTGGTSATLSSLLPPTNGDEKPSMCQTKPLWHFKDHKAAVKVNSTCRLTQTRDVCVC